MENKKIARIIAICCGIGTVAALAILNAKRKTKGTDDTEHCDRSEAMAAYEQAKVAREASENAKREAERATHMFVPREKSADKQPRAPRPNGYKGFLYIECQDCGKERTFYAKNPMNRWRCECGHVTELSDLRPAYTYCRKCENPLRYMTNLEKAAFSVECRKCGAPIDMERSGKGTEFVTVGMPRKNWNKEEHHGNH